MRNSFSLPRALYVKTHCPGAIVICVDGAPAEIYYYTNSAGVLCAAGFYGKQSKPAWRYSFKDEARRENHCQGWIKDVLERAEREAARKAERVKASAEGHGWKVGDILYTNWGYDQTNVEYYQVTALIGRAMVEVREIAAESVGTGWLQGQSAPEAGRFIGEPLRRRVSKYNATDRGGIKVSRCATAWPLEYKEVAGVRVYQTKSWTAYA